MAGSALLLASSAGLRVASLDLCADEYLLLLARPSEIASVSHVSQDARDNVLWRKARRFPATGRDLESALATRPTLLLSTSGGGRATNLIAGRMGIASMTLGYPTSIAEVERSVVKVAQALGDPRRADPWRARLARIKARQIVSRDAIFLGGGGNSLSPASLGAQWLALAGLAQRSLPGGKATLEILATAPPTVLLRSTYRRDQLSLGQRWLDHPLARRSRVRTIDTDGRPWTCAGPMMLDEIERLQRL